MKWWKSTTIGKGGQMRRRTRRRRSIIWGGTGLTARSDKIVITKWAHGCLYRSLGSMTLDVIYIVCAVILVIQPTHWMNNAHCVLHCQSGVFGRALLFWIKSVNITRKWELVVNLSAHIVDSTHNMCNTWRVERHCFRILFSFPHAV